MGVQQSKHSYVYKPKKKLRKRAIHNSVFVEKPEYLIYEDIHNNIDDNAKYNTTKSCIDIRAIQKSKDQSRPLSLDEEMLERPMSNISNVMHQYRQEVASEIAKVAPPIGETVSSKSQGSSDGFKDVYDDDYYDNQMDGGDFMDAMSYHSLDFETVRPTEIGGAAGKLNKSVEFEFEKIDSSRNLSRRSSGRRVKDNTQIERKPSDVKDFQANTSSKMDVEVANSSKANIEPNLCSKTGLVEANNCSKTTVNHTTDIEAGTFSKTNLAPLQIPAAVETVRQLSTESTIADPVTPKEIITLEDVTHILQGIKDEILHGEINDTEVYHQLLMCKKKAQSIHVTSIRIRAKKTILIGKINKFIHWFAISDTEEKNMEKRVMNGAGNDEAKESIKRHYENDAIVSKDIEVVPNNEQFDARTIFIVNTMKEQPEIASTNPFITPSSNSDAKITENVYVNNQDDLEIHENSQKIGETLMGHNSTSVEQEDQQIMINDSIEQEDQHNINNIDDSIEQEDQQNTPSLLVLNVYEQISNIRLLLQKVHSKMDAFTGRRYDLEYHNIIDNVFQARIMLNNVKGTELLEDAIIEDYEKFFEDLLLYFEELVDRNEWGVIGHDHETTDGRKTISFETQNSLNESEYYTNVNNQLSFDYKSGTSTNLPESEDDSNTHFVSLTEYDGTVIQTCEAFNKTIELQEDDEEADLSPDDDFIYKTNAVGQIVFEHEESQTPYIVDPISFSKCRMRPLSIIQEQFDEFLDCHYPENKEDGNYSSIIHDAGQESEDRDDWDSFDENVVENEQLNRSTFEKDDEIGAFEQLERNIDNIRTSMPDLVSNKQYVEGESQNSDTLEEEDQKSSDFEVDDDQNNGELEGENQNYDNFEKECRNDKNFEARDQNNDRFDKECRNNSNFEAKEPNNDDFEREGEHNDDFQEILSERYVNEEDNRKFQPLKIENIDFEENIIEHGATNDYYSLESMLPDDKPAKDIAEQAQYNNFSVENKMDISSKSHELYNDVQEEFLQPPTGNNSLDQPNSQNNEDILNLTNYNFDTNELKSYNEIMQINLVIDSLQSQIDHFTGTKISPEYMSTFKQIFDNMRVLNNIDNCDYQEDILNLIDYTSDKIQKCIFELDLKVS